MFSLRSSLQPWQQWAARLAATALQFTSTRGTFMRVLKVCGFLGPCSLARTLALSLSAALAVVTVTGCDRGEAYQPISGTVSVDGQPLSKGVITFYPNGPGTTVGGEVLDGRFTLARESGPTPGKYRVEIVAFKPSGRSEFDIDLNADVPIEVQYLPPKYNVKSQLEAEVVEGEANQFDFPLQTK